MSPTVQSLGIDRLSAEDRLRLIEEIWDTLSDSLEDLPLPESHKEELDRRLTAADTNPNAGSPWEEVKARLRRKP
jgi:putative addiction module component (TIGR02574 family)